MARKRVERSIPNTLTEVFSAASRTRRKLDEAPANSDLAKKLRRRYARLMDRYSRLLEENNE